MQKSIPIVLLLAIMSIFAGCGVDATSELTKIDTLLQTHPDSAYARLQSIEPNDLSAKSRAYYALLLTTAQYKNYVRIESDSVINIAVKYYSDGAEPEKRTRSYLYKGAVLAEMGYTKLALENYKQAEQAADTTDYLTMGLLNFRMGELYQKSYIKNEEPVKRYKNALKYFRKTNNRPFENNTLASIGQLYSSRDSDSSMLYLNQSLEMAKSLQNTYEYVNTLLILSRLYEYKLGNLSTAKDLLLTIVNLGDSIRQNDDLTVDIATLYGKLGQIDSASYYSKLPYILKTAEDTMSYHMMMEEISVANNNYHSSYLHQKISNKLADSLEKSRGSLQFYEIDKQFDNTVANQKAEELRLGNVIRNYIILSACLASLATGLCLWLLWKRKCRIEAENIRTIELLQAEMQSHQSSTHDVLESHLEIIANQNKTLEEKIELEKSLKNIAANRLQIMRQLLDMKYQFGDNPAKFFKEFDKITSVNKKSQADCQQVVNIANSLYDNIIDRVCRTNESVNDTDKLLLSLVCLEFGATEIKGFLNLPTLDAVYMARYRLGKKLKTSALEIYISDFKSEFQK